MSLETKRTVESGRKGRCRASFKARTVLLGVILLLKGHTIERPLQLVCPLEIRGVDHSVYLQEGRRDEVQPRNQRVRRPAAQQAAEGLQYKYEQKRRTKSELN